MRKALLFLVVGAALGVAPACSKDDGSAAATGATAPAAGGGARGGAGGRAGRPPMPVEFAVVKRAPVSEQILVVGNLIGAATVQVVPRVNGRLATVNVQLGDSVRRGQTVAKVEDMEIQEQVRQAEAAFKVAQATIRQRDADLKLAKTNRDRSKSLYDRQLLPQQTYDDTVAGYEAAQAQNDLANAQFEQAKARLDELKITLQNTHHPSPVDGFVGKRFSIPARSSAQLPGRVGRGHPHRADGREPGREGHEARAGRHRGGGRSGRVPWREILGPRRPRGAGLRSGHPHRGDGNRDPEPSFRLKPGMYSRVQLTVDSRANALTVPRNALVDLDGKPGVFIARHGGAE